MNIYLIRHAIATEEGSDEHEDFDRPLTTEGRKKMRMIAKGLKGIGVGLDLILSSPYVRARETAEILADTFKIKNSEIAYSENLIPLGDPDHLISELNEKYAVDSIAIVGHEPNLSSLTGLLISENAKIEIIFKKGGVCKLSADNLHHTRTATLEWLVTPKILVEIAEK